MLIASHLFLIGYFLRYIIIITSAFLLGKFAIHNLADDMHYNCRGQELGLECNFDVPQGPDISR